MGTLSTVPILNRLMGRCRRMRASTLSTILILSRARRARVEGCCHTLVLRATLRQAVKRIEVSADIGEFLRARPSLDPALGGDRLVDPQVASLWISATGRRIDVKLSTSPALCSLTRSSTLRRVMPV